MKRIPYGPEEDEILRHLWPVNRAEDVAPLIDRSVASVDNRAHKLGLHKDPAFTARNAATFRPGQEAWNKGRPQSEWMPAESRKRVASTQFRKGEMHGAAQHNWVPIGTQKVRDGQLVRKVTDDPDVSPAVRWQPVARIVWEAAHGPIPAGYVVRFKDGAATRDPDAITLDRLECVSRAENMRRNSYHTHLPPEVARLVQLRGALNRKINNRLKGKDNEESRQ